MVQLRAFSGPERLDMIDEPLLGATGLVLMAPFHCMMERGQSNHVTMTWQSDIVVGRNVVSAVVWKGHIVRRCNVDGA